MMTFVLNIVFLMQHYSELPDIKRVIVNTHAIEPQVVFLSNYIKLVPLTCRTVTKIVFFLLLQSLVEFFGTLSREWALECMKDLLLVNLRGNLQIIVQVYTFFFLLHIVMLKNITGDLTEAN